MFIRLHPGLTFLIVILLAFCIFPFSVSAHPLDQVYLDLYINEDEVGDRIEPQELKTNLYISWQELSFIAEKNQTAAKILLNPNNFTGDNAFAEHMQALLSNPKWYSEYILSHINILNNDINCEGTIFSDLNQDNKAMLLGKGVKLVLRYKCGNKLETLAVKGDILMDDFPYQTIQVRIFINNDEVGKTGTISKSTPEIVFNIDDIKIGKVEPIKNISNTSSISAQTKKPSKSFNFPNAPVLPSNPVLVLFFVFWLGILHTLEAGHSKSIIIALMSDSRVRRKQIAGYIIVFVITHISDIMLLGAALLVIGSIVDIYKYLPWLSYATSYGLLIISGYMLVRAVLTIRHNYLSKHDHSEHGHAHEHHIKIHSFKEQLILGFLSGLAPCALGWSLFMLVLSSHGIWFVFPVVVSFGLGIGAALTGIVIIFGILKHQIYSRLTFIGVISPLISALILFVIALRMIIK